MAINELIEGYVSRQEAKERGLKRYFTGEPCQKGHIAERLTNSSHCVKCLKERDEIRASTLKRRTYCKQHSKKYYLDNREKLKEAAKEYYKSNAEKINSRRLNNKEQFARYQRYKRNSDINFRLADNLRRRLNDALKRDQKSGSAVRDLGCSIEFLKQHLEQQFQNGMTWKNYGKVWEIDHIKPLCSFDLTIREQLLEVCHYTNLQPLSRKDNKEKISEDLKKRKPYKPSQELLSLFDNDS